MRTVSFRVIGTIANHYQQIVDESKARLEELRSNDENLEKFARETYQMKRDNEDVFIIIDD